MYMANKGIVDLIQSIANSGENLSAKVCIVDSVDKEARTIDCTPLDDSAPLLSVNLQANQSSDTGIVVWPRVGSYVIVGFIADGAAGVVLITDDIDGIEIGLSDTIEICIDSTGLIVDVGKDVHAEFTDDSAKVNIGEDVSAILTGDDITFSNGSKSKVSIKSDGIILNSGNKGGLVLLDKVVSQLNALENDINSLKQCFSSWAPISMDGGAALKSLLLAWCANQLAATQKSQIENTEIKQ